MDGHKEVMDENHQIVRTMKMSGNRNSGLQDENVSPELIKEELQNERKENHIHQVDINSDACADQGADLYKIFNSLLEIIGIYYENPVPELINVKGQYEKEVKDIQQLGIHSDPGTDLDPAEETNMVSHQQIKEEEIHVNINEGLHDYKLHIVTIKEEREYEKEDTPVEIHSDLCTGDTTTNPSIAKLEQEEDLIMVTQVKEEEIPININKSTSMNWNSLEQYHTSNRPIPGVVGKASHTENTSCKLVQHLENSGHRESSVLHDSQPLSHQNIPKGDKPFTCSDCGKCFSYKRNLICHVRTHTGEKPFACSECGKCFSAKRTLVSHEKIHLGEKPFTCFECGKYFTLKSNLIKHLRIHTNDKPFVCFECGNSFSDKYLLVRHQQNHTGEKPFACSVCGKCFSNKSVLVSHEAIHTGVKPFVCSVCGKCFTHKSNFISHQKIHTGEKAFACSKCEKRFSRRSVLVIHETTHTNVKSFVCSECGKSFSHKSSLVSHQKTHTGEKPFACSECGKCFSKKSTLISHGANHINVKTFVCS